MDAYGTTNGQILGWDGVSYDPERVNILKNLVFLRIDALLSGELRADDLKVFVKQEAHKLSKLQSGAVRLISAVSLVDTMIDRILFGWLGRAVLANACRTPCMVGWSPVRGGWRLLHRRFKNRPAVCLDKGTWDWTVPDFIVDIWLEVLMGLAIGASPEWKLLAKMRFRALFEEACFRFEDGTRVFQPYKGVMKSGCYLTIILNSLAQSALHYIANSRLGRPMVENQPYTIGDDTVQDSFERLDEYVQILESFGVIVKGAKVRHHVEFAGFAYDGNTCWPAYWQKHLFNLSHTPVLSEVLLSYQYLYVHEPVMYEFLVRLAREVGPAAFLPREVAVDIMDYE